jgi:hypothetical protein
VEIIFELVFQFVFEIVIEGLLELGWHGTAKVLRSRPGRYTASASVGFIGGVLWGAHVAELGQPDRPRLFWVSIVIAIVALLAAAYRRSRPADAISTRSFALPWTWPAWRLVGFAVLSGAVAAGIATGWQPPVVG